MSKYYHVSRARNIFNPKEKKAFKLSRSKIDLFLECPRCFYFDRRLGVGRPPSFPFNLNSAVDALLKKEFDIHRAAGIAHPLMKHYGVQAVPFSHQDLDAWRANFVGVQYHHLPTNFIITGAVDDIWINKKSELIVVDYKATSKSGIITVLDQAWQDGYKRQMEIYQWLLRQNGFKVSHIGYFVYCNGRRDAKAFDGKLEFDISLIAYRGSDHWVEPAIAAVYKCLSQKKIPAASSDCDYCNFIEARGKAGRAGRT